MNWRPLGVDVYAIRATARGIFPYADIRIRTDEHAHVVQIFRPLDNEEIGGCSIPVNSGYYILENVKQALNNIAIESHAGIKAEWEKPTGGS